MQSLLEKTQKARNENRSKEAFGWASKALETLDGDDEMARAFWFEMAVCAWYVNDNDTGMYYLNRLLLHPLVSSNVKRLMRKNAIFYVDPLCNTSHDLGQSLKTGKVNVTNPSIVSFETPDGTKGYLVTCRTVNYVRDPKTHRFSFLGDAKEFDSHTYLLWLDENMHELERAEVTGPRLKYPHPLARGIEDARLFLFRDQVWFGCTFPDAFPKTRTGLVHIGKLFDILETIKSGNIFAEACFTMDGPDPNRHEKNWIPYVPQRPSEDIFSIYSFDPLVILSPNLKFKDLDAVALPNLPAQYCQVRRVCEKQGAWDLSACRGGSCGIPWALCEGTGILFVVHEVDEKFHYLHRFVLFDPVAQEIVSVSIPFYLEKLGVEYCAGLCFTHDGKSIILSYGLGDYAAKYTTIPVEEIKKFI